MMKKKGQFSLLKVIIAVTLVLGLVYLVGVWYFTDRFSPNTYVDEIKAGGKKIEEVEALVAAQADHYALEIKTIDNRDQIIRASDMELSFELNDIIKDMKLKQGGFSWPFHIFGRTDYHAVPVIKIDEEKLEDYVFSLPIFNKKFSVVPQDARIDLVDEKFAIVEEIEGNVIKKKSFLKAVKQHIYNNEDFMDIDAEGYYKKPKIYRDDDRITGPMETLKKYNKSLIQYEIEGYEEIVDPALFFDWIVIDSDKSEVSINREKVAEYVRKLARKYDTWSLSREFKTTGAGTITAKGGSYGWLVERESEINQLIKDIEAGERISREPIYRYKAKARIPNDIGNTYVEIDISRQRMWFYKEGRLIVETPVVTGRPTPSRYTPVGVYPLNYKTKDATLSGQGYSSKVKLWMPFNNNIGIHDAAWRSRFGGEIYRTGGSHGCINTPYAAVQKIYPLLEKGDPIVVYASKPYIIREAEPPKPKKEGTDAQGGTGNSAAEGSEPQKPVTEQDIAEGTNSQE